VKKIIVKQCCCNQQFPLHVSNFHDKRAAGHLHGAVSDKNVANAPVADQIIHVVQSPAAVLDENLLAGAFWCQNGHEKQVLA